MSELQTVAVVDDRLVNRCNWKLEANLLDGTELVTLADAQAAVEAEREQTIEDCKAVGVEQETIIMQQAKRIATLEAALKQAREALEGTNMADESPRIARALAAINEVLGGGN